MELTVYDIIKGPVVSEKAYELNSKLKKIMMRVHMFANKQQIKNAFEKLFDVKIEKINCLIREGKNKRVKNRTIQCKSSKIAFITLQEGYTLDLFGQPENRSLVKDAAISQHGTNRSEAMRNK